MWVPASDSCVTVTLNIDTAVTATTRSWNMRVTQYECGNLMAPEEECLQYHTATTGFKANMLREGGRWQNKEPYIDKILDTQISDKKC